MKYGFIIIFLINTITSRAQSPIDSISVVKCDADSLQSYCIYLPANYIQKKPLPAIFLFDPSARGRAAVSLFKTAARSMDFIVIASNNSRNGPMSLSLNAANFMLTDAFKKYSIDTRQVYLAGFSGGARVATTIAQQNNGFAGVLACGAGFADGIPDTPLKFNFEGTTGTRDFNYVEMQKVKQKLDKLNSNNNLILFKGPHSWPPAQVILEALLWLDLQHRKNGLSHTDINLLRYQSIIGDKIEKTPGLAEKVEMYHQLQSLTANTVYAEKIKELEALKQYHDEISIRHQLNEKEIAYQKNIGDCLSLIERESYDLKPKSWWKNEYAGLIKMQVSGLSADSDFVWRQKTFINANISVDFENYYEFKKYEKAKEFLKVSEIFDPGNPMNAYHYAQVAAMNGNEAEAINYLEAAVKQGFKNKMQMQRDPAFQSIQTNKYFKALLVD